MTEYTTNDSPKLCECGCGQPTPIATRTHAKRGQVKGEPTRFCLGHHLSRTTPEERFWAKVVKHSLDGCWEWIANKNTQGYGQLGVGYKKIAAHRFSYELSNGAIPSGMNVLHRCDNPACVNPAHLFLGTQAENMHDMVAKGRQGQHQRARGEQCGRSKLSESDVIEIRRLHVIGKAKAQIARMFGVSATQVSWIIARKSWTHI